MKERVGDAFGIEKTQALKLIACAQIRVKIPDIQGPLNAEEFSGQKLSQNAVYEFARLAPKDDKGNYDFDKLNKRDVERVAKKVIQHCSQEGEKPTSTIVRQFVDEELGIDRAAQSLTSFLMILEIASQQTRANQRA